MTKHIFGKTLGKYQASVAKPKSTHQNEPAASLQNQPSDDILTFSSCNTIPGPLQNIGDSAGLSKYRLSPTNPSPSAVPGAQNRGSGSGTTDDVTVETSLKNWTRKGKKHSCMMLYVHGCSPQLDFENKARKSLLAHSFVFTLG